MQGINPSTQSDEEIIKSYHTFIHELASKSEPSQVIPFLAPNITFIYPGSQPITAPAHEVSHEINSSRLPWVFSAYYRKEFSRLEIISENQAVQTAGYCRLDEGFRNNPQRFLVTIFWEKAKNYWTIRYLQSSEDAPLPKFASIENDKTVADEENDIEKLLLKKTREVCNLNLALAQSRKEVNELEERLMALFNHTSDGIIVADWKNHNFTMVNSCLLEILGFSDEEFSSFWFTDIVPPDDLQAALKKILLQADGNIQLAEEIPLLAKNNQIKYFNVVSRTIKIKGASFLMSLFRDISAEKDAFMHKQKSEEARKASDAKNLFLANLSHEIRTPVTGILGMSDILSRTNLNPTQAGYLEIIKESSRILLALINDILDISRIEAGKLTVKREQFDLKDVFKNIRIITHNAMLEKKNQLIIESGKNSVTDVFTDRMRLEQILFNLVNNAIKFTENGAINIRATIDEKLHNQVKISVTDTGTGISKEDQERLFNKFQQLDNARSNPQQGSGLGLYICKQLVSLLDGQIGVTSTPGKGSTFWFTFRTEVVSPSFLPMDDGEFNNEFPLDLDVLLVDDKRVNLQVISIMLQTARCRIDTALNGLEALEKYNPEKHQIILMDIMMPVMDGITAMKELRKKYSTLPPIIAITANAMAGDKEKYIADGFDAYIPKPLTMAKLISELRGLGLMK